MSTRTPGIEARALRNYWPTKNPRAKLTSAAGKCLIKMDLPLAWSEPSPPYRPWKVLCPARSGTFNHPLPTHARPSRGHAIRARFQFVERQHGTTIRSCVSAEWRSTRVACKTRAISLPICSRICSLKLHSLQCQEKNEFVAHFFDFFFSFAEELAANTKSLGTFPRRRHSSTYKTR